jgi:hypothetical protein
MTRLLSPNRLQRGLKPHEISLQPKFLPMLRDDLCRATAGMLEGGVIMQSLDGKLTLRITVPPVVLGSPASGGSGQYNDGKAHPILRRAMSEYDCDRAR